MTLSHGRYSINIEPLIANEIWPKCVVHKHHDV